jgi:hypothetical protein
MVAATNESYPDLLKFSLFLQNAFSLLDGQPTSLQLSRDQVQVRLCVEHRLEQRLIFGGPLFSRGVARAYPHFFTISPIPS